MTLALAVTGFTAVQGGMVARQLAAEVVGAAAPAGAGHIVYTSFIAPAPDGIFTLGRDHYATEQAIEESGMKYTLLRDNLYLDFMEPLVGEHGVIRGPAGEGAAAVVDRADIARGPRCCPAGTGRAHRRTL
ncbi:MAG: nucleoside-diphosphate sugar epimerase [Cryobacterium sp.]|jgi:uncharacterized protein YbjT (DUF2867 family)|nr:nucleoside-diphosphate sugar epimerase [Cryobacterium sp.]